jgi:hypothetical protein
MLLYTPPTGKCLAYGSGNANAEQESRKKGSQERGEKRGREEERREEAELLWRFWV